MSEEKQQIGLPENATRELNPGEKYVPILPPNKVVPEANAYSVTLGLVMAVLFSAAAAYLGLKVGQVFEAAIPIAIIAVGLASATGRKNALGENVIIQSIGSASGVIVAGAIFTLPALYILEAKDPELTVSFMQVFLSSLLGGILGILFLIPFRKYFVSDMHGKYPFPEATATTQVLVSGEKGGSQAKPLLIAGLIGGLYDFAVSTFGAWSDKLSTTMMGWGAEISQKLKMEFSINTSAAVLGLGYIIGLKYSLIICAGSFFIWFFVVPLFGAYGNPEIANMATTEIFLNYGRFIGVGAIAMAGVIGIIKSWGVIKGAAGLAAKELGGKGKAVAEALPRTERDLSMKLILISILAALIIVFVFFYFGVIHNIWQTVVAFLVVLIISFLFTTVAANAIAIVGSNPVSGMTLMTLIVASMVLVSVGLEGTSGMVASMVIGGVVCTALSMAGGFITDLKIGYWIGVTPAKQETWKFLGTLVSAATVGGVMIVLKEVYGFTGDNALAAPQANAMAAVIEPLMMGQGAPWMLYGAGAILALLLNLLGVPVLPFALGMFIPLYLNTPLIVGGLISWYVSTRSKDAALNNARLERGTLLASGFIAGGALMGVVSAAMKFGGLDFFQTDWYATAGSQILGLVMYIAIIVYLVIATMKAKKA